MLRITFLGAGSLIFAKNLLGNCMLAPALRDAEFSNDLCADDGIHYKNTNARLPGKQVAKFILK